MLLTTWTDECLHHLAFASSDVVHHVAFASSDGMHRFADDAMQVFVRAFSCIALGVFVCLCVCAHSSHGSLQAQ